MLGYLVKNIVRSGTVTLIRPDGRRIRAGTGEPRVTARIHGWGTWFAIGLRPELKLGEAYMDGRLTLEDDTDIARFLDVLMANVMAARKPFLLRWAGALRRAVRRFAQMNGLARARRNVAHHYDLSGRLYDLFLDRDRQYSCAYFPHGRESLDEAQIAKKRHIAAKLRLDRAGLKILDIGCGWGGLALDLARDAKARVLGVTLSQEQLAAAEARARAEGLADSCRFALRDYRNVTGTFDRIVSVGMFEHVGIGHYDRFFAKLAGLLHDDGVALLHTIGRTDGPGSTNPWIAKYIFPGGYTPALSEVTAAIERSGLLVTDVEILRLHYAETLREWRRRFRANWNEAVKLYDERFCRMWDFYLSGAEMAFRRQGLVVFQIQMAKHVGALPLTRDYMFESERTMRFAAADRNRRANEAA